MQVQDIRNKIYQKYGERLRCNKEGNFYSYYDLYAYRETLRTIISRFSGSFGGPRFDEDSIVAMISTSVFIPGKTGIVITTDGMYFLPWSMLDMANGSYWSHESIYRYFTQDRDSDYVNKIKRIDDIFDFQEMANIMNDIFKTVTACQRKDIVSQNDIFSTGSYFVQNLCSILDDYFMQEKKADAFINIANLFGMLSRLEDNKNIALEGFAIIFDINQRLQRLSQELDEGKNNALYYNNLQDKLYSKILFIGCISSYILLNARAADNKFIEQISSLFGKKFFNMKLKLPELLKEIINSVDDDKYIDTLLEHTVNLSMCWNDAGEEEVYAHCIYIICSAYFLWTYVANAINMIYIQAPEREKESLLRYRDGLINYPNCKFKVKDKEDKALFKTLLEVQKKMNKHKMPEFMHTINGASSQAIDFAESLKNEIHRTQNVKGDSPLLICMYNYVFSAGVVFYGDQIIEKYLKGSPEYELIDSWGGYIDIKEIKTVSYIENVVYTDIQLDAEDKGYTIPITSLPVKYAPLLCEWISQIYQSIGLDIRVGKPISYKEEYAAKYNEIYRKYYKIKEEPKRKTGIFGLFR